MNNKDTNSKDFLKKQIKNLNELFDSPKKGEKKEDITMNFDELFDSALEDGDINDKDIRFGEQILRAEENDLTPEEIYDIENRIISDEHSRNFVDDFSRLCSELKNLFREENQDEDAMLV